MALKPLQPFNYETFTSELGDSINQMMQLVENRQQGGWIGLLQRYRCRNSNFVKGNNERVIFHSHFLNASDREARTNLAKQILAWGKMPKLDDAMIKNMDNSLQLLKNDEISQDFENLYSKRISSISKVYEMWNLDSCVNYDSYCVRGLQWMVAQYWDQTKHREHESLLKFPWPKGRGGKQISGFPVLSTPRQARLGFAYASWLCRNIAVRLNQQQSRPFPWRTYHIEMAAYQLGREI